MVRRALGTDRVGHLGTLDPFAAGLLVIVVGRATRLAPLAAAWPKAYEGVIRLGTTTNTDDATGEPVATSDDWRGIDAAHVERVLATFRGAYDQRPPAYSAVKLAGERAYRRARRGEAVELPARRVEVAELALVRCAPPDLSFRARVSGGTYLRSLARDVGAALGCGAHLAALTRTEVGPYRLAEAVVHGRAVPRDSGLGARGSGSEVEVPSPESRVPSPVALFADGRLVAVAERVGELLKPRVVVADE